MLSIICFPVTIYLSNIVIIFVILNKICSILKTNFMLMHQCIFFSLPHPIFHIAIPPPGSIIQTPTWYLCMVCYPHHSMLHWFSSRYPSLLQLLQTLCAYHPDNPDCLPMLWRTGTMRKFFFKSPQTISF